MPRGKCSLCVWTTYGKCCNPTCKNVVCKVCKLKKNYLCEECQSNNVTFVRGNRLSRGKKRKSDTMLQGQPKTRQHCSEERQISQVSVNSEPREAENHQDHQREEIENINTQVSVNSEPLEAENHQDNHREAIENINTQKELQCEKCGEKFSRLKFHLKNAKNSDCKNYYLLEYDCTNLEEIMLKISNLRRRQTRSVQGRDRSRDNEVRRRRRTLTNTVVSLANNFNRSCSNILTVQCVFISHHQTFIC